MTPRRLPLLAAAALLSATALPAAAPSAVADSTYVQPVPAGPVARALPARDADHTFGIAVLPDTQRETHTSKDHRMEQRSEFLAARAQSWDLRFAIHVGDVGDWDTPDHGMYANAARQLLPLEAAMPLAIAPGNHDTAAVCPGGTGCPGAKTWVTVRNTKTFNTYFPASRFGALKGQFEAGKVDNAYHTFRAGDVDWLVLNLELWPRKSVIAWANTVVRANPDKNVIVVTHSYLTSGGRISGSDGGYGATSPRYLFDHLIKLYPNVKMVLSGHTGTAKTRTDRGVNGNRIVSYLQCFHSNTSNPVRTISIHTDTGTLYSDIHWPSTGKRQTTPKVSGLSFVQSAQ